jgi:hypothetical protein
MSGYRLDRALCVVLEGIAILTYGYWGWTVHDGWARLAWAAGAMIVVATVWDVFRVPGDGVRPRVPVPGGVRLIIEAAFFTGVASSLAVGRPEFGIAYALLVAIHFTVTHERLAWLLSASGDG